MTRNAASLALLLGLTAAAAVAAVSLSAPSALRVSGEEPRLPGYAPLSPAVGETVMLQLFRGRMEPSTSEVSITTIFREPSFSVLADPEVAGGSERDLMAHLRELFSLNDVVSLGSSLVTLTGGSAVMDDEGHRVEIHVEGRRVGRHAVRLVVSQTRDGREIVATSVIARTGRTVVLAGPASPGVSGDGDVAFVCLTPL